MLHSLSLSFSLSFLPNLTNTAAVCKWLYTQPWKWRCGSNLSPPHFFFFSSPHHLVYWQARLFFFSCPAAIQKKMFEIPMDWKFFCTLVSRCLFCHGIFLSTFFSTVCPGSAKKWGGCYLISFFFFFAFRYRSIQCKADYLGCGVNALTSRKKPNRCVCVCVIRAKLKN